MRSIANSKCKLSPTLHRLFLLCLLILTNNQMRTVTLAKAIICMKFIELQVHVAGVDASTHPGANHIELPV